LLASSALVSRRRSRAKTRLRANPEAPGAGAALGVGRTTRHALTAPRRLGSIRARSVRRRVAGTGPGDPYRAAHARCLRPLRALGFKMISKTGN